MPADTVTGKPCDDCGTPLVGRFCHACGQDSFPPRRAFKDLLMDGLDNVFSFTEHVLPTLRDMAIDPGRVLRGLRDGDRKRYLSPFKLYVTATLVFFLFISLAGISLLQFEVVRTTGPLAVTLDHEGIAEMKGFFIQGRTLEREQSVKRDEGVVRVLAKASSTLAGEDSRAFVAAIHLAVDQPSVLNEDIATWAPRALWLLMPIYALMIWPLYARGAYLSDHLIFSIGAHSTLFLLMILGGVINLLGLGFGLGFVLLAYQVYLTVGLKGYYQRSWTGAVLKGGLISAVYAVVWGVMSFVFFVWQSLKFLPPDYLFTE